MNNGLLNMSSLASICQNVNRKKRKISRKFMKYDRITKLQNCAYQ